MDALSKNHAKEIAALGKRKERTIRGRYVAEGPLLVRELLGRSAALVEYVVVADKALDGDGEVDLRNLVARAQQVGARVETCSKERFAQLASTVSPAPVLAVVRRERFPPLGEFLAQESLRVLVLDGVQDPGNAGTLVRAAAAFGVTFVLCGKGTTDLYNAKAVRASMGAIFGMPVFSVINWREGGLLFSESGIALIASQVGAPSYREFAWPARFALAVGGEGAGVTSELRDIATAVVGIPQSDAVESLNAAMSGAILLADAYSRAPRDQ